MRRLPPEPERRAGGTTRGRLEPDVRERDVPALEQAGDPRRGPTTPRVSRPGSRRAGGTERRAPRTRRGAAHRSEARPVAPRKGRAGPTRQQEWRSGAIWLRHDADAQVAAAMALGSTIDSPRRQDPDCRARKRGGWRQAVLVHHGPS
jgi:hypothetical protein